MDAEAEVMVRKNQFWNRDVIKYIAMFTMLLNHIGNIFLQPGTALFNIFVNTGYFTAITMCYFLVEGYRYTHSKKSYGCRLLVFAILSQIPYNLALSDGRTLRFTGFSMIFTLLLCFLILLARERIANPFVKTVVVFALVVATIISDWALLAAIFTIMFDKWRGSKKKMVLAYGIAAFLFALLNYSNYALADYPTGEALLLAFCSCIGILVSGWVVLFLYNGKRAERGRNFSKWFFYVFYPGHLLILGLIRFFMFP